MAGRKKILCVDFDGVIHSFTSPWSGPDVIKDSLVPGFFEWAWKASETFDLYIYSARSSSLGGMKAMKEWLLAQMMDWGGKQLFSEHQILSLCQSFYFTNEKPPAFLTIDDRAICFKGDWSAEELKPEVLEAFIPWNKKDF